MLPGDSKLRSGVRPWAVDKKAPKLFGFLARSSRA
jgi:hypothetical protein